MDKNVGSCDGEAASEENPASVHVVRAGERHNADIKDSGKRREDSVAGGACRQRQQQQHARCLAAWCDWFIELYIIESCENVQSEDTAMRRLSDFFCSKCNEDRTLLCSGTEDAFLPQPVFRSPAEMPLMVAAITRLTSGVSSPARLRRSISTWIKCMGST